MLAGGWRLAAMRLAVRDSRFGDWKLETGKLRTGSWELEAGSWKLNMSLSRDAAWALMTEYTQSESLRKHMLAVEASVRGYARLWDEPEEDWAVVALLHDFDTRGGPIRRITLIAASRY